MGRLVLAICALALPFVATTAAALELRLVLSGLDSPLYVTHARDGSGRLFMVEQGGVIKVLQPGGSLPTVFLDISDRVLAGGERGLLGLAFHPHYPANGRFFVNYTRRPDGATVMAEYRRSADPSVALRDEIVRLTTAQLFANHNGGMLEFGPDGFLFIGTGDGGSGNDPDNRAQNVNDLLGKILRIDVDRTTGGLPYAIPADNPFAGAVPGRDEIYALGLRNPFRFCFDRATGQLIAGDVGQDLFEEIDGVARGANLGWRVSEGFHCTGLDPDVCARPGFTPPIAEYTHGGGRCSVTGGYVYRGRGGALPAGTYVFGDYCSGEIFTLSGSAHVVLLQTNLRIASFGEDEAGEVYVVGLGGTVLRMVGETETARQNFISGLYTHVLGRAAGAGELAGWADFLRGNCNAAGVQALARGFFGSGEFRAARSLSLSGLVTVLYRSLLGREPDPAGLAGWADVLSRARLGIAVNGFIPSQEFRSLLPDRTRRPAVEEVVRRVYTQILGRSPDAPGLTGWVDLIVAAGDLESAAVGFLTSPEFEARSLTFQGYVTILYRAILGREPDPAGLAAWQGVLQAALLDVVETGFLPAMEFDARVLCGA